MLYPKDTQKWKQFTTSFFPSLFHWSLCCIPKILKNESNSQPADGNGDIINCCVVSQRYSKMKAIHNLRQTRIKTAYVVLYPKDTQKWKQFTTISKSMRKWKWLCCIPKILKNESNSQQFVIHILSPASCVVSQRYSKMKAIHNH